MLFISKEVFIKLFMTAMFIILPIALISFVGVNFMIIKMSFIKLA